MADLVTEWFMEPSVRTNYRTMVYYKGDGQDTFEINFDGGFIYKEDVKAFSVKDDTRERKNHKVTFVNGSVSRVKLDSAIPKGWTVCIYRDTPKAKPLAQFTDGAIINEANLDRNAQQAMFAVSEMVDRFDSTVESVEAALQQVYEANKKADQAISTANKANSTANTAVGIANGAVKTANEAKQSAANANTTADGAVKTANEAKSIALGLDGQIKQANTTANNAVTKADSAINTANEAKATANGIDAKATKALNDSAQALKVANGIDGKATQALNNSEEALDKANSALQSQVSAKELTDRVGEYLTNNGVNWKGRHYFKSQLGIFEDSPAGAFLQYRTTEGQLRLFEYGGGKSRFKFYIGDNTLLYNDKDVYYAGILNPYFNNSVITRNNGYGSRFTMVNNTNNDKVELIQDTRNKPYLESRSGSNGSVMYRWDFPDGGGMVLTDKYWHRFEQGAYETNMFSPDKKTYLNIKNNESGIYNTRASRWDLLHTDSSFRVFGDTNYTGLHLTRANGSYVRLVTNLDFLSLVHRNADETPINGVVRFPRPTLDSDEVVYRSKVYGKSETYRKDEVYNKSESDSRYMRKGSYITWDKIGDFNGKSAPATAEITEDILGKFIYVQRGTNEAYVGVHVPPIPNTLFAVATSGNGFWEFKVSSDGRRLEMVDSAYGSARGIYVTG